MVRSVSVDTPDGRRLHARVAGEGERAIVAHVGTPNAGLLFDPWVQDAQARGLMLVSYDRPGYGQSTRQEGRTVADCAGDLRAISDAVGFARCAVWGVSGGGPHALACAGLLDGLVTAAATIGSSAPFDAPDLDFYAGQSDAAREDHELFVSDRPEWERQSEAQRAGILATSYTEMVEELSAVLPEVEAATLRGDFGVWLHESMQEAIRHGSGGWIDDDIALHSPWGFDPASISVPVRVWHGGHDPMVPAAHGRWLATHIPTAESELRPEDGHGTVVAERIGDVHHWLSQWLS